MAGKVLLAFSLLLLALSLTQPAFQIGRADADAYSNAATLFFLGWMGVLGGSVESLLWAANPLFFIAIYLLLRKRQVAVYLASAAFLLALTFAFLPTVLTSESGARSKVTSLQACYYLWLGSMATLLACTLTMARRRWYRP